jgi:aspartyl-tRNA(Asn)/glutamyl-tRNA(Gln) amidotransferase subunit A
LVVERLLEAGALVVGRANMDELAYGVTGTNPHTGQVRNPWNLECHPGGSSAGSAASVAGGMVPLALGTDTAGSVRIPAALCGLFGLRPTHGAVPLDGIAPLAPSMDCVGAMATNVGDLAALVSVLMQRRELADSVETEAEERPAVPIRALVLEGAFAVPLDPRILQRCTQACAALGRSGVSLSHGTITELAEAPKVSGPLIGAEAAYAWASELQEHPQWFGAQVADNLHKGMNLKATRYLQASEGRQRIRAAIDAAFAEADYLLLPTTATVASSVEKIKGQLELLALTVPFSLSGHPALTVPVGEVEGLPVGMQIVGRRGAEAGVLQLGRRLELADLF